MLCENCGKKTATTYLKMVVNGRLREYHLCADCAREKGYEDLLGNWGLGSLLTGLIGKQERDTLRCEKCGSTFEEISKTGKVGCAGCYDAFREKLIPVIQRIHGTTKHVGKTPGGSALRVQEQPGPMVAVKSSPIEEKKRLLKEAVEAQDFERAAVLRDEIKELEANG